jgi:hypothetical protein
VAQRVVLHIGAMKSGTSYLQRLVGANRDLLAGQGVKFPGRKWRDQVLAVSEVLERKRVTARREGAWQGLVDELADWDGTGLVSMEFLGPAAPAKVERVVSSFPAGSVEVVVTARDLGRNVPAMWQEGLKNGRTWTFEEYVAAVAADEGPGKLFWRDQGIAAMCRRWSEAVGVDRVTLVTVPPPGGARDELWRRFAAVLGVDGGAVELPESGNESLGAASAEVMRRLNDLVEDLDYTAYAPVAKHVLAKATLGPRRPAEQPVAFGVPDWLRTRSAEMTGRLSELGVRVVGDLAELEPVSTRGVDPGSVERGEQLDAALAGLEGLVRALVRRRS